MEIIKVHKEDWVNGNPKFIEVVNKKGTHFYEYSPDGDLQRIFIFKDKKVDCVLRKQGKFACNHSNLITYLC